MTALRYSHIGLLSNANVAVHQSLQGGSSVQQVEAKIVFLAGSSNYTVMLIFEKNISRLDMRNFFRDVVSLRS